MRAVAWTVATIGGAAAVVLALGCASTTPGAESDSGNPDASSSSAADGDASYGDSPGSGSDGEAGATFDAEIPDALPTSCPGQPQLALDPDAAPHTCAFTPADVACNTNADCTTHVVVQCQCIDRVYGVNTANTIRCPPPPCPPPINGCPSNASGYRTQDCQVVVKLQDVAVACVGHQCLTYAAPNPRE
jgi:hypothetical protein